ncbi:MAG: N-acetylmuramoyl-L-alanine amidase [bacterium]|nr:N-acetylmuramoyl-L-alanine amidase [bacterium]
MTFSYSLQSSRGLVSFMWLAMLCVAGLAPHAEAASVSLDARFGEETRHAQAESIDHGGIVYVCLTSVVRQFRGECSLLPSRVQVDLHSQQARIGLNGTEVSSSLGPHSLRYPAIEKTGNVYIALTDLKPFFARSFRVTVTERGRMTDQPGAAHTDDSRVTSRELLEPVEPDSLASLPLEDLIEEPDGLAPIPEGSALDEPRPKPVAPLDPGAAAAGMPSAIGDAVSPGALRPDPLTRIRCIVIDPGHGGNDTGAVGQNGLTEKDLVLALALKIQKAFQERTKVRVLLTRAEDVCPPVEMRSLYANHPQNGVGLFVSLHAGASLSPTAQGVECFCPPDPAAVPAYGTEDRRSFRRSATNAYWSRHIAASVVDQIALAASVPSRGVHGAPCRVLSPLERPGFLLEVGFLTNSTEAGRLDTEAYQTQLADAIVKGLLPYCATAASPAAVAPSPASSPRDEEAGLEGGAR